MTVGELIEWLNEFDENTEVVIGMRQKFGSDFMHEILNATEERIEPWYGEATNAIVITEGDQIGVVRYDYEEDEYNWDDDFDDEDY